MAQFSLRRLFIGVTVVAIFAALTDSRVTRVTVAMASAAMAIGCLLLAKRLALHEAEEQRTALSSGLPAIPLFFIGVGSAILCFYSFAGIVAAMIRG